MFTDNKLQLNEANYTHLNARIWESHSCIPLVNTVPIPHGHQTENLWNLNCGRQGSELRMEPLIRLVFSNQVFQQETSNLLGLSSGTPSCTELSVAANAQQLISPPSSDQVKSSFFSPTSHNLAVPSREHVTMLRPRSTMAVSRMAVDKTHGLFSTLSQPLSYISVKGKNLNFQWHFNIKY